MQEPWGNHAPFGRYRLLKLCMTRGGSRIFEREGSRLGLPAKRGGGRRGANFGPNVKKPTSWHKRGGGS